MISLLSLVPLVAPLVEHSNVLHAVRINEMSTDVGRPSTRISPSTPTVRTTGEVMPSMSSGLASRNDCCQHGLRSGRDVENIHSAQCGQQWSHTACHTLALLTETCIRCRCRQFYGTAPNSPAFCLGAFPPRDICPVHESDMVRSASAISARSR